MIQKLVWIYSHLKRHTGLYRFLIILLFKCVAVSVFDVFQMFLGVNLWAAHRIRTGHGEQTTSFAASLCVSRV